MSDLFFYGSLRHRPLLERVLGHDAPDLVSARLPGHTVHWAEGQPFPTITESPGEAAEGVLLRSPSAGDVARLDFYEGGFAYDLRSVTVETGAGPAEARVYFPNDDTIRPGDRFDLHDWIDRWSAVALDQAEEVMARFGRQSPEDLAPLMPVLRGRAWARQLAATPAPARVRRVPAPGEVMLDYGDGGHEGFFRVRTFTISHRRFDGGESPPLKREAMVSFDVALVLPYDPQTDRVLLVEQLRYGPLLRGDPVPFVLEAVAGFVEAGETPEDAARRETLEEARLDLRDLRRMPAGYASPGYSTEFYHFFLGLCSIPETGALTGADDEHEDIRTHVLSFDVAMDLLDSGEINAAPLTLMLLWLARARPGLRAVP